MDYSSFYNPNNKYSSPSTPILIPSSCSRRTTNSKNAKNNNNNNNNNNKAAGGVRLSTDPQSVAARERRHRISDRFKMLQSLIPGGAKLDTVSMLEQAIQYVKFLKAQIWLHEALIKNNNDDDNSNNHNHNHNYNYNNNVTNTNNSNNINNQDQYDHSFIINTTINNDAYYYEQYCYALMYDCNNIGNQHEDGGAGGSEDDIDGGFCDHQEINTAVAATNNYRAIQLSDSCSFHGNGQQNM